MALGTAALHLHRRRHPKSLSVLAGALLSAVALLAMAVLPRTGMQIAVSRSTRRATAAPPFQAYKTYRFFEAGGDVYHAMNFTCPVPWEWTDDIETADAVWNNVLHGGPPNPARSHPDQKLVFMSLESGQYYPIVYNAKKQGYDFSVDYRIWPGHPEGMADIPAVYLLNPTMDDHTSIFRAPPPLPKKKGTKLVAAFVSNCRANNDRARVLEELAAAGVLDSFGACTHTADESWLQVGAGLSRQESKMALAGRYPFVFTPENSNEVSYVTEKVYGGLQAGSVPIYMGAPDIDMFVPHPSAIIKVSDFNSTAELVEHLRALADDDERYMRHFEWKKKEYSDAFKRVLRLEARTVQCRLAMHLEGLPIEM